MPFGGYPLRISGFCSQRVIWKAFPHHNVIDHVSMMCTLSVIITPKRHRDVVLTYWWRYYCVMYPLHSRFTPNHPFTAQVGTIISGFNNYPSLHPVVTWVTAGLRYAILHIQSNFSTGVFLSSIRFIILIVCNITFTHQRLPGKISNELGSLSIFLTHWGPGIYASLGLNELKAIFQETGIFYSTTLLVHRETFNYITHWGLVRHTCVCKLDHHWFR